jgi:hypothetical protein
MEESNASKPQAFVIMPFGEGFDEIYGLFIASAISEAGYEVIRADDIRNQQNILKDVLSGLAESDLVIADLTGSNPNVYYELGLAHAFEKRVILLTQHVDELPFDLRSYRVIPYSTHFAEIAKARVRLFDTARDALDARITFGSPVTDFRSVPSHSTRAIIAPSTIIESPNGIDDAGILDYLVDMEEGFATLGKILAANTAEMESMGEATNATGERLIALASSNGLASARRAVVMNLATRLTEYAKSLGRNNDRYATALSTTRGSLESLIRAQNPSTEKEKEELRAFLKQLDQAEESARGQRQSLRQLIETIRSSPRVERTFNRAADATVRNLEGYAQNVDQTLSMIVRARELVQNRLS